jgi:hypothetical protein
MGTFRDFLRRGNTAVSAPRSSLPDRPSATREVVVRIDDDEAQELDYSHMREDRPSLRPIRVKTAHPLIWNMGCASMRSGLREASIFFHRLIQRDW